MAETLAGLIERAREQLSQMTGLKLGSTVSVRRLGGNPLPEESGGPQGEGVGPQWRVRVEVVEKKSLLDSQDLLATYDLAADAEGRVLDKVGGAVVPRVYVAGWIKRGPSGVIGTNKPDSIATVAKMLEDAKSLAALPGLDPRPSAVDALLQRKGATIVTFADWKRLDQAEIARGKEKGKPREKFTTLPQMLAAIGKG